MVEQNQLAGSQLDYRFRERRAERTLRRLIGSTYQLLHRAFALFPIKKIQHAIVSLLETKV